MGEPQEHLTNDVIALGHCLRTRESKMSARIVSVQHKATSRHLGCLVAVAGVAKVHLSQALALVHDGFYMVLEIIWHPVWDGDTAARLHFDSLALGLFVSSEVDRFSSSLRDVQVGSDAQLVFGACERVPRASYISLAMAHNSEPEVRELGRPLLLLICLRTRWCDRHQT